MLNSKSYWVNHVVALGVSMHWWLPWGSPMLVFVFGFTYGSNVTATMALSKRFIGWTKGPTYEIGVFINVFWTPSSEMVIHGQLFATLSLFVCSWSKGVKISGAYQLYIWLLIINYWVMYIHGGWRGVQLHTQWVYLMWGGLGSPFIMLYSWVAWWCLYPPYQILLVVPKC